MDQLVADHPGPLNIDETTAREFETNVLRLARKLMDDNEASEARYLLERAATLLPDRASLYVCLGEAELDESHFEEAIALLEHARRLGTSDVNAARFLAAAYDCVGREVDADTVWRSAFPDGSFESDACDPTLPQLLVLVSPLCANMQFRNFIFSSDFQITRLFVDSYHDAVTLPSCEAVLVAIANPELCPRALRKAGQVVERLRKPCINHPRQVLATSRLDMPGRLRDISGVVVPAIERMSRTAASAWEQVPLLIRAIGYHGGRKFEKVDRLDDLPQVLERLPGEELLAISYIETKHADGAWRKYRVMAIDGTIYPLHLAIASQWNVHYFSSAMADNAAYRAEEARFLNDMDSTLGRTAVAALENIIATLELDYVGIDFALDADGNVVVFEANAAMVIAAADGEKKWEYRRPAIARVIEAARSMTLKRAQSSKNAFLDK